MNTTLRLTLLAALAATALSAHATLIDFEGLTGESNAVVTFYEPIVSSDGFRFAASYVYGPTEFLSLNAISPDRSYYYTGSTALATDGGAIQLTRTDGGAFDLRSLDVANLSTQVLIPGASATIHFVGRRADGSSVARSFTTALDDALQPVVFEGFTDLVSVSWDEGYRINDDHQFDNVNVQAVPEPAPLAALGVGALGLLRRRLRKAA